jgi:hypothetical protein
MDNGAKDSSDSHILSITIPSLHSHTSIDTGHSMALESCHSEVLDVLKSISFPRDLIITFDDRPIHPILMANLFSFPPSSDQLCNEMTLVQHIELICAVRNASWPDHSVLKELGLSDFLYSSVGQLHEEQRLLFALFIAFIGNFIVLVDLTSKEYLEQTHSLPFFKDRCLVWASKDELNKAPINLQEMV